MSIRITEDGTTLTVDSAPWITGLVICAAILGAVALALTGVLAATVPAAWWWMSAAAGGIAFAAFVSRETLRLDAATGEARFVRSSVTGVRASIAPLSAIAHVRLHERISYGDADDGASGPRRLRRVELTVRGDGVWAVPDAFVGGPRPAEAAEAIRAFLARHGGGDAAPPA